jgi:hypothetical protein
LRDLPQPPLGVRTQRHVACGRGGRARAVGRPSPGHAVHGEPMRPAVVHAAQGGLRRRQHHRPSGCAPPPAYGRHTGGAVHPPEPRWWSRDVWNRTHRRARTHWLAVLARQLAWADQVFHDRPRGVGGSDGVDMAVRPSLVVRSLRMVSLVGRIRWPAGSLGMMRGPGLSTVEKRTRVPCLKPVDIEGGGMCSPGSALGHPDNRI